MSMVPAGQAGLPARPEGLEDFETSDQVLPIIRIDHKHSSGAPVFVDQLSNEFYPELDAVLLGLIKQRILWPAELPDDGKGVWLCRSYEFKEGHPTREGKETFPWDASGFDQATYPEGTSLPCANCKLKEWDTHPSRNAPWCSAQYTFAMMLQNAEGNFYPSLLQIQRSALKPANAYLSSFANAGTPLFTVFSHLTLESHKKGNNVYGVPKFSKGPETPAEAHQIFGQNYRSVRDYLQTPFSGTEEEEAELPPAETPVSAPAAAAPAAPPTPTPAAAPVGGIVPPPAPAQATAPASAPAEAPGAAPVSVPAGASAADDDEELPF